MKPHQEEYQIISLDGSHLEEVFEFLRLVYEQQTSEWPIGGAWTRSLIRNELYGRGGVGLFNAKGHLRGVLLFRRNAPGFFEIYIIAVHPKFRSQGIAKKLIDHLILKVPNGGEIWLEVHEKNLPASQLYQKLGFQQTGHRKAYYRDGATAIQYAYKKPEAN